MKKKPNPGSEEAQAKNCRCPVIDNHYGKGVPMNGKREFWISGDCPLHNDKSHD